MGHFAAHMGIATSSNCPCYTCPVPSRDIYRYTACSDSPSRLSGNHENLTFIPLHSYLLYDQSFMDACEDFVMFRAPRHPPRTVARHNANKHSDTDTEDINHTHESLVGGCFFSLGPAAPVRSGQRRGRTQEPGSW